MNDPEGHGTEAHLSYGFNVTESDVAMCVQTREALATVLRLRRHAHVYAGWRPTLVDKVFYLFLLAAFALSYRRLRHGTSRLFLTTAFHEFVAWPEASMNLPDAQYLRPAPS